MTIPPYRLFQIVSLIVMSIILFFFLKSTESKKNELLHNAKYTIAITNGSTQGLRNVFPFVNYYYYVNNRKYNSSINISLKENPININGGRYLVAFSEMDFQNSEFLYLCPIPDSILISPIEGWTKIPFDCFQK